MRIIHVINNLNTGGAEKLLCDMLPFFQKKNEIAVDILLLDGIKTPFKELLEQKGIKVLTINNMSIYNPFIIFKIKKYLKNYDLAHVHLFPSFYWVSLTKLFFSINIKLIVTEHSPSNNRRKNVFFRITDKWIYNLYDKIICISEGVRDSLTKFLEIPHSKVSIINNGINISDFENATPLNLEFLKLPSDVVLVAQVASFRKQKDQETVIKAINLLNDKVHLLLVGDGNLINHYKELVDNLSLSDRVHFLGNRYDIPNILKAIDILVVSSHYEGFGLAAVEGMASGKPIISSNIDGLNQITKGYGLIFEKRNYKQLSNMINKLIIDCEYRETIGTSCKKRAVDFSINKMANEYIKQYKKII